MVSNPTSYVYRRITHIGLKIEGVGTTARQYRFVSGKAPAWDSDSVYQDVLLAWPDSFSSTVDFRTGKSQIQSVDFELRRTSTVLQHLWRVNPLVVAETVDNISATSTTVETNNTGLAGQLVHWEREVIKLGTHAGSGVYTGCTRGFNGSFARRHGDHIGWDRELFSSFPPGSVKGRIVSLFVVYSSATGYGDEETIWTGVLDALRITAEVSVQLTARSILALVEAAELMKTQRRWGARDVAGRTSIYAPDAGYGALHATTRRCVVASEKDKRVMSIRWDGVAFDGPGEYYLVTNDQHEEIDGLPRPEDLDNEGAYWEVHSTSVDHPSNAATVDTFTLPLSQDPATLVLQLLTTTASNAQSAVNGIYDLGIDNLAGDIDDSLVDVAGIEAWGRRNAGVKVDRLWIGLDGEPENLADILRRVLQPLGSALVCGADGRITVAQYQGGGGYNGAVSIPQDKIVSVGHEQDRRVEDTVSTVVVSYDKRPGGDAAKLTLVDARKNRRLPAGDRSSLEVEAWYYTGTGRPSITALGASLAASLRVAVPALTIEVLPTSDMALSPGQTVTVTHPALVANGAPGWTDELAIVVGSTLQWDAPRREDGGIGSLTRRLDLIHIGALYATGIGAIAPSAQITAWSAGSKRLTVAANAYATTDNDYFDKDVDGFQAGDKVQIVDQYGTVKEALAEVASTTPGSNYIFLVASPSSTPTSGDILRHAPWDDATTAQRLRWAFIADSTNTLGGVTARAYSYTD